MAEELLQRIIFNNPLRAYLIALTIFISGIIVLRIFRTIILRRLKNWAETTAHTLDDLLVSLIEKKVLPICYVGFFYLSVRSLTVNPTVYRIIEIAVLVVLTILVVRLVLTLIRYGFENYWFKRETDSSRRLGQKVLLTSVRVILWTVAIIILLDNLGVKISALIAGLGISGIVIGFALQAILKDLFNYFVIFFDRPFEIGDFIIVGDLMGTVEHVGLKTTRVTSLGGEQLVFSNTDLTDSRIRNYKKMQKRRVVFSLGVTYDTDSQQLKEIPEIITKIIDGIENTRFDRAHFFSYGDFSLIFEIVYYVMSNNYNKYMTIQQEINFRIKEEFDKRGIEFAYPTQTLYLNKTPDS
ncbi:MAG: mechanosensitive ion channel [Nitrospiraceae bacterium]|jgi:small-conductance mechanosensitive channel|nr:MAG: mechanosensitive ion channel [Nitrospiraceae bacterium]